MTGLNAMIEERAAESGARLAIQYRPRYRTIRWNYQYLRGRVGAIAAALERQGVTSGDRVLLFAENSPDWAAAFFAVVSLGAVVVPLNPKSTARQLEGVIGSAEPKLLLASNRAIWPASAMPALSIQTVGGGNERPRLRACDFEAGTLAEIIYTSGTTGDPKGVMLSHGNLLSDLDALAQAVPLEPHHHVVSLVPLFHAYGQMTSLFLPLRMGCPVTYLPSPTSRAILEALAHTPATHLVAVPEVLKTMMERLEDRIGKLPGFLRHIAGGRIRRRVFGSLKTIACGGAALDPAVEEKWWALGFEVLQGYGLTETSPVLTVNTPLIHRVGSVGKPVAGADIRISAEGEVLARGPMVMAGYYRDAKRTDEVLEDGWLKTDDGGRLDADGFLYVFGRRRYMILGPGGENVFPEDIEAELNRIPGVIDSAVVGLEKEGRVLVHAVLLCDPPAAESIVAGANGHLAPHQHIMSWSVWPEPDFPRSVTRKVKKEEVIRHLAETGAHRAEPPERVTALKRLLGQVTGLAPESMAETARLGADLGIDSLLRIELVSRIEDQWGVVVEEVQLGPQTTVGALETLVEQSKRSSPRLGQYPRWSLRPWACRLRPWAQRLYLQSWIALCCRLRVEGVENLTGLQGPVIFMANHRSFLDSAVATFALPGKFRWRLGIAAATAVLYREYAWAAPLGELALNAFPFPTGVDENIRPGLDYFGRLLDDGWNVLIFPEGQLNRGDRGIQTLRGGTGVIAVEMQVPVVPMTIEGTETIIPPDRLLPRRVGTVTVRFGEPVAIDGAAGYAAATNVIAAAMREVLEAGCVNR